MNAGGVGLLALGVAVLCAFSVSNRLNPSAPRIDRAVRAAQRWAFMVAGSMMFWSACLAGDAVAEASATAPPHAAADALHRYILRDILAWKNVLHGGFLLAGFGNFAQTGNSRYYTIALTLQCFVAAVVVVQTAGIALRGATTLRVAALCSGAALFAAQSAHSALVGWRAYRLWQRGDGADSRAYPSLAATSKLARNARAAGEGNTLAERAVPFGVGKSWVLRRSAAEAERRWRRAARAALAVEGALFLAAAASCVAVWTERWVATPAAEAAGAARRGDLLYNLVMLYTSAVHQAWVLGNGVHGAASETSSVHALEAYSFAKLVLTPAAACSALAAAASATRGDALPLARFGCLAAYALVQPVGGLICWRLGERLRERECDSNKASPLGAASAGFAPAEASAATSAATPSSLAFSASLESEGGVVSMRTLAKQRGALDRATTTWAARCVAFAVLSGALYQLEAALLIAVSPRPAPGAGAARELSSWGGALSEALGFGLHGVASTFWALYRVPQQLCDASGVIDGSGRAMFTRRKTYIGLGAALFALMAAAQVVEAIGALREAKQGGGHATAAVLVVGILNACKVLAFGGMAVSYLALSVRGGRAFIGVDAGNDASSTSTSSTSQASTPPPPIVVDGAVQRTIRSWGRRAFRAYQRAAGAEMDATTPQRSMSAEPSFIRLLAAPAVSDRRVPDERLAQRPVALRSTAARRAVWTWAGAALLLALLLGAAQVASGGECASAACGAAQHLMHSSASDLSFHFLYIINGYAIRGFGRGGGATLSSPTPMFLVLVRMALGSFAFLSSCALIRAAIDGGSGQQQWGGLALARLALLLLLAASAKVSSDRIGVLCRTAARLGVCGPPKHALV